MRSVVKTPGIRLFRFGPFELRPDQGVLKRSGIPVRLQPQPARLLVLLVSNAGEIVTRSQIQQTVWSDEISVDYELGVNRCIRQIRSALIDDPESPRYVKTIPRLGYTFIAPVERIVLDDSPRPAEQAEEEESLAAGSLPQTSGSAENALDESALRDGTESTDAIQVGKSEPKKSGSVLRRHIQNVAFLLAAALIVIGIWQYFTSGGPIPRIDNYQALTSDSYAKVVRTGTFPRSICSDGLRTYFAVFTGAATSEIAQVADIGGETSVIPIPLPSPMVFDCSALTSSLLLGSGPGVRDVPLWMQPMPSGSTRRLADYSAHGASWSPDAQHIAYANDSGLFVASNAGTESRLLAAFEDQRGQVPFWPRWSHDGKIIRFSVYDKAAKVSSLWEIAAAGGKPFVVLPAWPRRSSCCGTWTRDGSYYIFVSAEGERNDLWVLPGAGNLLERLRRREGPVRLTAGPLSYSAPATNKATDDVFALGETQRSELASYDSVASNFVPVAPGIWAESADFSRNGEKLAFISFREGSLWRANADRSGRAQLTFLPLSAHLPQWSPDGTRIAFFGHVPGEPNSVYIVTGSGGTPQKVASEVNHELIDPDWSADGNRVVFSATSVTDQSCMLKILNLKAGDITEVPGSRGLRSPRWSPDGQFISALSADLSNLFLYREAVRTWERVAHFRMGYPNWSHDSKYIYLVNLANHAGVSRFSLRDRKVEPVLDMTHFNQFWTGDAWLGLTANDSPLL